MEEVRELLLRLGQRKFGAEPSKKQQKTLGAITELHQLEILAGRLVDVDSWTKLLANGR